MILMIVIPFATFAVVSIATAISVVQLKRAIAWKRGSGSSLISIRRPRGGARRQDARRRFFDLHHLCCRHMVPEFHDIRKYANIFLTSHPTYLVLAEANSSVNFLPVLGLPDSDRNCAACFSVAKYSA